MTARILEVLSGFSENITTLQDFYFRSMTPSNVQIQWWSLLKNKRHRIAFIKGSDNYLFLRMFYVFFDCLFTTVNHLFTPKVAYGRWLRFFSEFWLNNWLKLTVYQAILGYFMPMELRNCVHCTLKLTFCVVVSWCSIIIIIIIIYSFRVFHISVSWWFLTGVWVTASLLKSPGLVSGFWPLLAMLSFG